MSEASSVKTDEQGFRQVFQRFTSKQDASMSLDLSLGQQSVFGELSAESVEGMAEVPGLSACFSFTDTDKLNSLDHEQLLGKIPGLQFGEGQVLSSVQGLSGESLPPQLVMAEQQVFAGIDENQSTPLELKNELFVADNHPVPSLALQTPQSGNGALSDADRLLSELDIQKSVQRAGQNTQALLTNYFNEGMNENAQTSRPDFELKRIHLGPQSPETDSPKGHSLMQSAGMLMTHVQNTEQGLKAGSELSYGPNLNGQSEFDFVRRESGLSVFDDPVVTGTFERSGNAAADVRSVVQGEGLRQYATGVGVHVDDPDWGEQMSQKIVWLSGRNIQSAEVQLTPAELGPIEVKISIQNDQASVVFNAQHASVRELLEANIHRLREMMGENGVDLGDVNVASEDQNDPYSAKQDESYDESSQHNGDQEDLAGLQQSEEQQEIVSVSTPNMIDFYA